MIEVSLNKQYRGASFDIRFCAKNKKHACEILECSMYYLNNYCYCNKTERQYKEIFAKPYGTHAIEAVGHKNEMLFEDAKKLVDVYNKEVRFKPLLEIIPTTDADANPLIHI
ncbi:hypothetical protein UFOVP129_73 [uncultured Caudovirales phage]|uniref:Uncharacterized protein n=1 Tax=uncultured Caudovirales phage TaxID=2100421 RepID=A0A6J5LCY3_9CAUD|nr:hypothetical protein UFOVP129_73 [uncultured Caudovirales phage]